MLIIRKFNESDAREVQELFYSTVHTVNIKDYTQDQINMWAPEKGDPKKWIEKSLESFFYVAVMDNKIVGFANITPDGHVDCFYVHHAYQGRGVGKQLMAQIEKAVANDVVELTAEVSITAKPFFERQGFVVEKEELADACGTQFIRYCMSKRL